MTHAQRAKLDVWVAAQRDAGRLRTQSVYGLASAATEALGFTVDADEATRAWNVAIAADLRRRKGIPA